MAGEQTYDNTLYTSDGKGEHHPPPADAPAAQHFAWAALVGLSLACHATGAGIGQSYRNALIAYEREWGTDTEGGDARGR